VRTKIYALCDENESIRYIGRTYRGLQGRLCEHLLEARKGKRSHRHHWIRSVLARGFVPAIRQIGEVEGDGYSEEQSWIEYLRGLGVHLVNATDGGAGPRGYRASTESLKKLSERMIGRKHALGHTVSVEVREILRQKSTGRIKTPEELSKISLALKGRIRSVEHCEKIRLSKIGHVLGPEGRAKVSRANTGRKHTPEARAKISAALRRRHHENYSG